RGPSLRGHRRRAGGGVLTPRNRGPRADASYAAVWANLRRRYPDMRTLLVAGASRRDDPTATALALSDAIVRFDNATVLVLVLDSAMQDRRDRKSTRLNSSHVSIS